MIYRQIVSWARSFPRGHTWGRIETTTTPIKMPPVRRFPRGHTWGRIETTTTSADLQATLQVSPGVTPGGGLKHRNHSSWSGVTLSFPRGHTWGRIETIGYAIYLASNLRFPPGSHLGAD